MIWLPVIGMETGPVIRTFLPIKLSAWYISTVRFETIEKSYWCPVKSSDC